MRWRERFFDRRRAEARLEAELQFHLEQQTREWVDSGASPGEARRRAQLRLGGIEQIQERCRGVGGSAWLEILAQDVRHAWRQLRRTPVLTLVAIATLALATGATTAIFSLAESALFPPFAAQAPGRLAGIYTSGPHGAGYASVSYPDYLYLRAHNRSFQDMAAYVHATVRWSRSGGAAVSIPAAVATPNFFRVLGLAAARGRTFAPDENPGAVAVVSYRFWRQSLDADPNAAGRTLTLNGRLVTVIGVAPRNFRGVDLAWGATPSLWMPMPMLPLALPAPGMDLLAMRQARFLLVVGRMRRGVDRAAAAADLSGLAQQLAIAYPATNHGRAVRVVSADDARMWPGWRRSVVAVLELLGAGVGLVLLIACANLAGLLLARASARRPETAVRLALGCSRARIARQLLVECGMLCGIGAGAGLGLAATMLPLLGKVELTPHMHMNLAPALDARVLGFTAAVAVAATLLAGLWPAWQATRGDLQGVLQARDSRSSESARRLGSRRAFIVAEVALAFVSLTCGLLFLRNLQQLEHGNLGFQPRHLLEASILLPPTRFEPDAGARLQRKLLTRVRQLPGVRAASLAEFPPLHPVHRIQTLTLPGLQTAGGNDAGLAVETDAVSPGFFTSLGGALLQGRAFDVRDGSSAPPVAIVNRTLADRLWPGESALGRRIHLQGEANDRVVIGVAAGMKLHTAWEPPTAFLYLPLAQQYVPDTALLVRAEGDPAAYIAPIRRLLAQLAPGLPVESAEPMTAAVHRSLAQPRLLATLLGWLALIAIVLALVGLYSLLAYSVQRRTREIGVRMALGAQRGDVARMVMQEGLRLAAVGVVLGIAAGVSTAHLLRSLLHGVTPGDPGMFALSALLLLAAAAPASYIPARRAARLDPLRALRRE